VKTAKAERLANDLVRLLKQQIGLQSEIASHMQGKIEAMKKADSDRIHSILARESVLLERAAEREGLRRQLIRKLASELEIETGEEQKLRLSELAEHFSEPLRSELLTASAGMKRKLQEIERTRDTMTLITKGMLEHLQDVIRVMTAGAVDPDIYSRTGKKNARTEANVFEAVG
jgi:hypothetical protein